jgi:FtsH-binding integral membrane protein
MLGLLAERLSQAEARALVDEPSAWATAIAVHALLWILFERARRSSSPISRSAWLFVIPSPLLLYAAGAATWQALRWSNLPGPLAGVAVMFVYGGVVLAVALAARRRARPDARVGTALGFAAVSNMSALLLVLLPHEAQTPRILTSHVDWVESLWVLGTVALMVGLSFLVARRRRTY